MRLPGGRTLASPVSAAIDQVVEGRYGPAVDSVRALRARRPGRSPAELVDDIVSRYRRELGGMGAVSGAVAAVPAVGTAVLVAGSVSESGWSLVRLGQMILEVGVACGHDARDVEERRAWVLAVLALAMGTSSRLERTAGLIARPGGVAALKTMPAAQVTRVNRSITTRLLVRWGSTQAAIRLGNAVPLGIGAAVGVGANALLVTVVGARARAFFDPAPQARLGPGGA